MKIEVQVLHNQLYWVHHLERISGDLFWVYGIDDPDSQEAAFPDIPILDPRGRDTSNTIMPYMEGDI